MANTAIEVPRLGVIRCALTGAVLLIVMFVICWAAAAAGAGGSHMYLSIFTLSPVTSLTALGVGVWWSIVFGTLGGALIALIYNSFGFLSR